MHQLHAIQRALELIARQLAHPLSVDSVARQVGMSPWHFQRAFAAMVGERASRYILGRRLAEAGRCLRATNGTVREIALEYGFESPEAFTQAFKAATATTPDVWRRLPVRVVPGCDRVFLTGETLNRRFCHLKLVPEIVALPARTYLGLQISSVTAALSETTENFRAVAAHWSHFIARLGQGGPACAGRDVLYGLCDRPESLGVKAARPDEALYLAAVQVAKAAAPPPGWMKWVSPAGTYAKFTHRGPFAQIGTTMDFIYAKWFSDHEFDRGEGPDLERMDARFDPQSPESVLEIFIPVQPRRSTEARTESGGTAWSVFAQEPQKKRAIRKVA